jgi:type VI secretion system protein ImpM
LGQAPGFFGKVRSLGDFVGRRLPPEVRDCFDRWLQEALVRSRQDLGDDWLGTWLSSPIWRFVVAAGVCGEQAWAGVMMPSHDRVGRCFPLLLMVEIEATPSLRDCLTVHDGWFEQLEDLALSSLEEGFSLEVFDAALLASIPLSVRPCSSKGNRPPALRVVAEMPTIASTALADADMDGQTAWWTDGSLLVAASLAICSGFPPPAAFASLLDGRWIAREWTVFDPV